VRVDPEGFHLVNCFRNVIRIASSKGKKSIKCVLDGWVDGLLDGWVEGLGQYALRFI